MPFNHHYRDTMSAPNISQRPAERKERAAQFKEAGNALFREEKYAEACEKYTAAVDLDDQNAVYLGNRSACHFHLEKQVSDLYRDVPLY